MGNKRVKKDRSNLHVRSFKTELVVTNEVEKILDGQSRICNWLYNQLLDISIKDYKENNNSLKLTSKDNFRDYMVRELKPKNEFLKTVHSHVLRTVAYRIKGTYKNFFERRESGVGFPKFKSWKREWFSLQYDYPEHAGVKIDKNNITFSLGKDKDGKQMKVCGKLKDAIPYKQYKMNVLTITKERGKFYVSISCDIIKPKQVTENKGKWVMIDPNHKNFFVAVDYQGNSFEFGNMKCVKYFDRKIDKIKSRISNTKKQVVKKLFDKDGNYVRTDIFRESKTRKRLEKVLKKLQHRRREQIKQSCYSIANFLTRNYDFVGFGDYVPSLDTSKFDNMHRSMLNQSHIGHLRRIVEQVCGKNYKNFKKIDEVNTTKRCSCCGEMEKKAPNVRSFTCKNCGTEFYRDINSGLNFAINEGFIQSCKDINADFTKPKYTFELNHLQNKFSKLIV